MGVTIATVISNGVRRQAAWQGQSAGELSTVGSHRRFIPPALDPKWGIGAFWDKLDPPP